MRFGLLAGFLLLPTLALAADTSLLGSIVPPCTEYGLGSGVCQACNLAQLGSRLLRAFVALAVMGSALMLAYAGWLYVSASGDHGNLESAKKVFSSTFIGLVIVLVAWLVVDIALRTFTNQSLNVLTAFQCVKVQTVSGGFSFPETPQDNTDVAAGPTGPAAEGKGLDNVDSNTNYNPVACSVIHNYQTTSDPNWRDRNGFTASCTDTAKAANATVRNECMQGCMGSANAKRIVTTADYKYCTGNPNGSIAPITQAAGWQSFGAMTCKQVLANGVTVATPVDSGITRGQRFTWPELARRYGLPDDTVFVADDSYSNAGCGTKAGCTYGHPVSRPGSYSIDVARCVTAAGYNVPCNEKSYGSSVPMKTKPTPVPGG